MPDDQSNPQAAWLDRARAVLPAGGFGNFAADIVVARGEGGRVWDENGRDYVDLLIGSGPMLVGHSHPEVVEAVREQLPLGQTFFAMNARGIELAEAIVEAVACAERVRFVSSGSEADMYAMRLARAHTGREKILKFEGGYHGMSDQGLMSLAPKRLVNFPMAVPDSAGILQAVREATLIAPFNDAEAVTRLLDEHEGEVAAIIVEPFQRLIPPAPGFLEHLRAECTKRGIVLIFDEVVTGFRLAYGGAQEAYGVTPDLCTLGKVIGGGFPLAAIAGADDIMAHFDKERVGEDRFTFQVGTLSGNPIAAVAGLKTMEILRRPGAYDRIRANGRRMMQSATDAFGRAGISIQLPGDPVLFDIVVVDGPVRNYREWFAGDRAKEARIGAIFREHGVLKPLGKVYTHLALTDDDLDRVDAATHAAAEALAAEG
jgi:glutamate-1-semialdehyde 2,1-aminomutase